MIHCQRPRASTAPGLFPGPASSGAVFGGIRGPSTPQRSALHGSVCDGLCMVFVYFRSVLSSAVTFGFALESVKERTRGGQKEKLRNPVTL